jgi:N-ethylmaleimide reductase
MNNVIFESIKFGAIELNNRIVMAPMTRSRAGDGDLPTDLHVDYYTQRATAGMIITEGTQPSANGKGYCRTPGIHTPEQVQAWCKVVDSVSAKGGTMVMQLMHVGRVSSKYNKAPDSETVAPSAIQAKGQMYTDSHGMVDFDMPRALETEEIVGIIAEYKQATANALEAGFAGVEFHATSGYLPAQFLSTGTNQRSDQYGGSVENRIRFVVEALTAMCEVAGADKVGIRICPGNPFNDLSDDNPEETFRELLTAIDSMGLAYLHVIRMPKKVTGVDNLELAKAHFKGPRIFNDSYTFEKASQVLDNGDAQAISFGRYYVANPDLVEKFKSSTALADFNHKTLYTPGAEGYSDY